METKKKEKRKSLWNSVQNTSKTKKYLYDESVKIMFQINSEIYVIVFFKV